MVELINDYHNQTPATRDEQFQINEFRSLLAQSITTHSNSVATVTGGLSSEWRDNTDMITDLATGGTTLAANAALSPQHIAANVIANTELGPIAANQRDQHRNARLWALLPPEILSGKSSAGKG